MITSFVYESKKYIYVWNFTVAASKKKEDAGIFSDDDDFLGGLGIEDKGSAPSTASKPKPEIEDFDSDSEEKPAPRMFDKLLGKDSNVTKHLETKERKEFVLDKKYTQPDEGNFLGKHIKHVKLFKMWFL